MVNTSSAWTTDDCTASIVCRSYLGKLGMAAWLLDLVTDLMAMVFFMFFFPEHFHLWFLIHFSEFSARLFLGGDFWLCSPSVSVRVRSRDEKGTRGSCLVANGAQRPRYAGGGSLWMASFWYCKQGDFWRIRAAAEQCSGIRFWRNHLERALCWHPWCGTVTMMAHVLWTGKW